MTTTPADGPDRSGSCAPDIPLDDRRRQPVVHRGSCLCGRIRFELMAEPGEFGFCHCVACQKASGSAHAANAPIDRSEVRLLASTTLREFESSPGKFRAFCSACGSPVYAYLRASFDTLRIRLGLLDSPLEMVAKAHTWVSECASWAPIMDPIPQFDEWADRETLHQKGSRQDLIE
jgi:hypothetical protein